MTDAGSGDAAVADAQADAPVMDAGSDAADAAADAPGDAIDASDASDVAMADIATSDSSDASVGDAPAPTDARHDDAATADAPADGGTRLSLGGGSCACRTTGGSRENWPGLIAMMAVAIIATRRRRR